MYHSHLLVNTGDNPDRPNWNITRKWLRNLYRVHQRLCMAFPSSVPASHAERVGAYCAPFNGAELNNLREMPGEPDASDVHYTRSDKTGFLFRIDHPVCDIVDGKATLSGHPRRRPVIVVQSVNRPDWHYAFGHNEGAEDSRGHPIGNASFLLAGPPQTKEIRIDLEGETLVLACPEKPQQGFKVRPGDVVRFRFRANPVECRNGKRHRLRIPQQDYDTGDAKRIDAARLNVHKEWLTRKLGGAAESVEIGIFVPGWAYGWRTKHEPQPGQHMQWWSVLFEGKFRVGDVNALRSLLESGIGPAKAFGFGLLSLARAWTEGV